jgi:L-lysine 2,3-aminomutase
MSQKFFMRIDEVNSRFGLKPYDRNRMETVCQKFLFQASEYYLSLIDRGKMHRPV